jgi:hypothetical protein
MGIPCLTITEHCNWIRSFALGVILEASLYGSTGVPPVNPFKLKNLVGLGNLDSYSPLQMLRPAFQASSMTIAKVL